MLAFKTSVQTSNNILIYFYLFLLAGDCSYIHACDAETDIIYFHSSGDYWAIPSQFPWGRDISTMPVFTIKEIEQFFESSGKTKNTRKALSCLITFSIVCSVLKVIITFTLELFAVPPTEKILFTNSAVQSAVATPQQCAMHFALVSQVKGVSVTMSMHCSSK